MTTIVHTCQNQKSQLEYPLEKIRLARRAIYKVFSQNVYPLKCPVEAKNRLFYTPSYTLHFLNDIILLYINILYCMHIRLKIRCRKACRFDSDRGHHFGTTL
jgi:hypothetical protein